MRIFKIIINIVTIILLMINIFGIYNFINSETEKISTGLALTYEVIVLITLVIYRISLIKEKKVNKILFSLTLFVILTSSLMYFDRSYVSSAWNLCLLAFILLCGLTIFKLIDSNKITSRLTKVLVLISTFYLSLICILELQTPIHFQIIGSSIFILSLLIIINIMMKKKIS